MPEKKMSAGLRRNSIAILRNAVSLISRLIPTSVITGPINLARKMDVCIAASNVALERNEAVDGGQYGSDRPGNDEGFIHRVLSLRRHDPDQVQRVFLSPKTGAPLGTVFNVCARAGVSMQGGAHQRCAGLNISRTNARNNSTWRGTRVGACRT